MLQTTLPAMAQVGQENRKYKGVKSVKCKVNRGAADKAIVFLYVVFVHVCRCVSVCYVIDTQSEK